MSAEVTFHDENVEASTTPPPQPPAEVNGKKSTKTEAATEDKEDKDQKADRGMSPEMRELRRDEDRTLKDLIEGFGTHTAYRIRITRKEPQQVKDASGKPISTAGFLEWVEGKAIDEAWVQDKYGGGKYELMFKKRGNAGGWTYGGQVTVEIAGEPNLGELPRSLPAQNPVTAVAAAPQADPMAKTALDLMSKQLERAQDRAERADASNKGDSQVVDILREQLRAAREETAAVRQEMRDIAARVAAGPPPTTEDKLKDSLLNKLMDGDSARLQSVRMQFESEMRQLKESQIASEARIRDAYERQMQSIENAHRRELDLLTTSHNSTLAASKASHEVQLAAANSAFTTQTEILKAEVRKLERDNTELRDDLKELRGKKEKSIVEQVKEMKVIKEALGLDDDKEEQSTAEKVVEAISNPETIEAVTKMFRGQAPPPEAAPQPAAQQVQQRPKRTVVKDQATGQTFIQEGNKLRPAKKFQQAEGAGGAPPVSFDPEQVKLVVGYLERAYAAGTDPEIVAQSGKTYVPDATIAAIRDVGGVDAFLSKVAKLPGSSPLSATQAGRNWVKKVGKALVGE